MFIYLFETSVPLCSSHRPFILFCFFIFITSEDYAGMCNIPWGREQRPYGNDALVAGSVHEYEVSPDYMPSPEEQLGPTFYENKKCEYQT